MLTGYTFLPITTETPTNQYLPVEMSTIINISPAQNYVTSTATSTNHDVNANNTNIINNDHHNVHTDNRVNNNNDNCHIDGDPFGLNSTKEIKFSKDENFTPIHGCCDPQNIIFGAAAQADICKCDPNLCRKNGTCCPGCPGEETNICETHSNTNNLLTITESEAAITIPNETISSSSSCSSLTSSSTTTKKSSDPTSGSNLLINYPSESLEHSCCA